MALTLDRMALDDVGANPARLAAAIHVQLGETSSAVPVFEIARALDIIEIRSEPLDNFEGALLTDPERSFGSILLNRRSSPQRRRFTAGHELLHFLSPAHIPHDTTGFRCRRTDMTESQRDSQDRHRRQEAEANAFAIELLAPRQRIKRHLHGLPDLAAVLAMAAELDISKEAAARRYVECHRETLALVFGKNNHPLYWDCSRDCPALSLNTRLPLPDLPGDPDRDGLTTIEEAAPDDWLRRPEGAELALQTLYQQSGRSITLLHVVATDDDDGSLEDTFNRFERR